jgi:hypothetical protein
MTLSAPFYKGRNWRLEEHARPQVFGRIIPKCSLEDKMASSRDNNDRLTSESLLLCPNIAWRTWGSHIPKRGAVQNGSISCLWSVTPYAARASSPHLCLFLVGLQWAGPQLGVSWVDWTQNGSWVQGLRGKGLLAQAPLCCPRDW